MQQDNDLQTLIDWIIGAGECFEKTNDIQCAVHELAKNAGWYSKKEYPAPYKAPQRMRKGRVDLMVSNNGVSYAIEIDDMTVKTKSIEKLRTLPMVRIAVVARGRLPDPIDGIDVVATCVGADKPYRINHGAI